MNKVLHKWNNKYAGDDLVFGIEPNVFLTSQIQHFATGGKLLAVGDGEGRNGIWLAQQGFDVLSVDGAENGVIKAIKRAHTCGLNARFQGLCVDLLKWDWPVEEFDTVVSLHVHFMPDERRIMYKAMIDALKPGGILLIEVFHPDQVGRECGGPNMVELCVTPDDFKKDLDGIDILVVEKNTRDINPSKFHPAGEGIVSRVVARKTT